ncbi:MAG: site-2 protease family protein [Deltaproteobacteria bacterium]|nr:site-2 protease family protein [Deltaproteobacteria bacterium]
MFGNGVKLTKIFGIELWIDYSWLIVFILVMWSLASGYFPHEYPGLGKTTYWIMGAVSAILLFVCVLLHELSHSYVAQKSGIAVPKITLFIFGGVAQISEEPRSAKTEFNIAIAGPICSFMLAVIFWILAKSDFASDDKRLFAVFNYLAFINIALVVFNMIPGFPLDGGRILRAYLWNRWQDVKKATYIVSQIGSRFGIALMLLGLVSIFFGNLIGGIWFIFIGLFLNQAASSGYQMTILRDVLSGAKVKNIMTSNVISVPESLSLNDLVQNYFYHYLFVSFPVVSDGGQLVGMISIKQVKDLPKDSWHEKKVGDIMVKAPEIPVLSPDDEALSALNLLMRNELGRIPIVDTGKLVGIITRRDIMTFLMIKSDLGV